MIFFGHVAISVALADLTDADPYAATAGNLLPDVIDKTLGWVLGLTPSRWLAHGLPCVVALCALSRPVLPGRSWRGFVLGYTSHLVADLWAGGRVPWLAPLGRKAGRRRKPRRLRWLVLNLIPEVVGVLYLRRRFDSGG
jgi:hypothetical protein